MKVDPTPPVVVQSPTVHVSRQYRLIIKAIREGSQDRKLAARELAEYRNIASVAVLMDVLFNDGDAEVRRAAARSLGEIGDPRAIEPLKAINEMTLVDIRKAVHVALKKIERTAK